MMRDTLHIYFASRKLNLAIRLVLLVVVVSLCGSMTVHAQKNLIRGQRMMARNMYEEAIPYFTKEILNGDKESKTEAMIHLANCYRLTGQFAEAEKLYKQVFQRRRRDPINALNYAKALKSSAKYAEAAEEFEKYAEKNPDDPMGAIYIESCHLAQKWLDNPSQAEVRNITPLNTIGMEYAPIYFKAGMMFSSSRVEGTKSMISFNGGYNEILTDIYYVDLQVPMDKLEVVNLKGLNTPKHEGPATWDRRNRMLYFTRTVDGKVAATGNSSKKSVVVSKLQIFRSHLVDNVWSEPVSDLPFNSLEYSVGHPSISSDGMTMYFMSDMPGGYGGTDIYVSRFSAGVWSTPENLGAVINTFGHELYPYIKSDGTLFFSSDTHPGLGKLDVFSSKKVNGQWTNAKNLKPPINSIGDDFGISFSKTGDMGFFSSTRFNGLGEDDLYSFTMQMPKVLAINGNELVVKDHSIYDGIVFKVRDEETKVKNEGEFQKGSRHFKVDNNRDLRLSGRKEGFSDNKIYIRLTGEGENEYMRAVLKSKSKVIRLKGIVMEESAPVDSTLPADSILPLPELISGAVVYLMEGEKNLEKTVTNSLGEYGFSQQLEPGVEYTVVASMEEPEDGPEIVRATPPVNNEAETETTKVNEEPEPSIEEPAETSTAPVNEDTVAESEDTVSEVADLGTEPDTAGIETNTIPEEALDEMATLHGVLTEKGKALKNANVKVMQGGQVVAETTTQKDGSYNVDLPVSAENEYKVVVSEKNSEDAQYTDVVIKTADGVVDMNFDVGEMNTLDLGTMASAGTVEGLKVSGVLSDKGEVIEKAQIKVMQGGVVVGETTTNSDGTYVVDLPESIDTSYTIVVTEENSGKEQTTEVAFNAPDGVVDMDFDVGAMTSMGLGNLDNNVKVFGVLSENGENVQNAIIKVMQGEKLVGETTSKSDGSYVIDLPTGADDKYEVFVSDPSTGANTYSKELITSEDGTFNKDFEMGSMETLASSEVNVEPSPEEIAVNNSDVLNSSNETVQPTNAGAEVAATTTLPNTTAAASSNQAVKVAGALSADGELVRNATIKLLQGDKVIGETTTDKNGSYSVNLPANPDSNYSVYISRHTYFDKYSEVVLNAEKGPVDMDFNIDKMQTVQVKGNLQVDSQPAGGAHLRVSNEGNFVEDTKTNNRGDFELDLVTNEDYEITATKKGFFQKDVAISTHGMKENEEVKMEMNLERLEIDKTVEIKNLYYDYNSVSIRYDSYYELEKVVLFLQVNTHITIELWSHADARGKSSYNVWLSQRRADVVADFLISKGVNPKQVKTKAFGETLLVVKNAQSEVQHQKNRRTEFKVIEIDR